jgi:hypothetical protein
MNHLIPAAAAELDRPVEERISRFRRPSLDRIHPGADHSHVTLTRFSVPLIPNIHLRSPTLIDSENTGVKRQIAILVRPGSD